MGKILQTISFLRLIILELEASMKVSPQENFLEFAHLFSHKHSAEFNSGFIAFSSWFTVHNGRRGEEIEAKKDVKRTLWEVWKMGGNENWKPP